MQKHDNAKPLVTIRDVASHAGVSPATVSRVLNNHGYIKDITKEAVLYSIGVLGYDNRTKVRDLDSTNELSGTTSFAFKSPLLVFNVPSFSNPFYGEIIRGAQASASRAGYHLLINSQHINSISISSLTNLIRDYSVKGMVVTNTIPDSILHALQEIIPVVQCSEYNGDYAAPYVSIDDHASAKRAVEYILSTGRRNIMFMSTPLRYQYANRRREGYIQALNEAGIRPQPDLELYVPEVDFELAYQAAQSVFTKSTVPDAIFAVSDVLAAAAIKAAQVSGFKIPLDVLVVGFDNVDVSLTSTPTITTISQPKFQLGYRAVELLCEELLGNQENKKILLNTELLIRESSTL